MTDILCYADSYMREFDATVTGVTPKGVVLDRTTFYPGGGGQPSDTGELIAGSDSYTVKKLSRVDGRIVHELGGESLPEGTEVRGRIDWERRYQLMRTHTALHILCGVVWRDYGAQVTGGDMKPLSARMDFELEQMSADFAVEMEARVNAEIEAAQGRRDRQPVQGGGLRQPRPDSYEDQPAAARRPGGAYGQHCRPGPPGGRGHARRQHVRGGARPGRGPREQRAHQQEAAHQGGRVGFREATRSLTSRSCHATMSMSSDSRNRNRVGAWTTLRPLFFWREWS